MLKRIKYSVTQVQDSLWAVTASTLIKGDQLLTSGMTRDQAITFFRQEVKSLLHKKGLLLPGVPFILSETEEELSNES